MEVGLRIPDDLSIMGFDGIPMAAWPAYNLTTIAQQVDAMIDATIDILLARLDDPGGGAGRCA